MRLLGSGLTAAHAINASGSIRENNRKNERFMSGNSVSKTAKQFITMVEIPYFHGKKKPPLTEAFLYSADQVAILGNLFSTDHRPN